MHLVRPSSVIARILVASMAASAILLPLAARAALANHDCQAIVLHRCAAEKHDRAIGPLASAETSGDQGTN